MRCIVSPFDRCCLNIAGEEYFMENFDDDVFYLYVNKPCVVIGKHQNAYAEINQDYVQKNGIDVVRRNSGGGAVYHDLGNLNYGFITKSAGKGINDVFQEFTKPVLKVLNDLGVNAVFSGRNDLTIDGKKFSGNAQYRSKDRVMIHGTLLFSSDIERLSSSLNADPRKFEGKSVQSVKSRVTNILPHLPTPMTIDELSSRIIKEVFADFSCASAYMYEMTEQDRRRIEALAAEKYSAWEWNYGKSPEFNYRRTLKYGHGLLDISLQLKAGTIENISVHGDFFGEKNLDDVLLLLKGQPFDKPAVSKALQTVSLTEYIFCLSNEEFIDCIFHA